MLGVNRGEHEQKVVMASGLACVLIPKNSKESLHSPYPQAQISSKRVRWRRGCWQTGVGDVLLSKTPRGCAVANAETETKPRRCPDMAEHLKGF